MEAANLAGCVVQAPGRQNIDRGNLMFRGLLAGAIHYGQEFLPLLLQGRGSVVLLSLLSLLLLWWTATACPMQSLSTATAKSTRACAICSVRTLWYARWYARSRPSRRATETSTQSTIQGATKTCT